MTGLNLEPFLRLLRADLGAWVSLGAILCVLGLMAWTSWGSRRALRKCLVLSIGVHVGLLIYGGGFRPASAGGEPGDGPAERIQSIRIVGEDGADPSDKPSGIGGTSRAVASWDKPGELAGPKDDPLRVGKIAVAPLPAPVRTMPGRIAAPKTSAPDLKVADLATPDIVQPPDAPAEEVVAVAPARPDEIPEAAPAPSTNSPSPDAIPIRVRPERAATKPVRESTGPKMVLGERPKIEAPDVPVPSPTLPPIDEPPGLTAADRPAPDPISEAPAPVTAVGGSGNVKPSVDGDLRERVRSQAVSSIGGRMKPNAEPIRIARNTTPTPIVTPAPPVPMNDVPEVYKPRVDPNRAIQAKKAGASDASEKAVDLALDWLARHQDADGRWNAGTKKYQSDDSPIAGERNFTMHCPPGEVCSGECYYYEADTAMTGLALLAYLGAGHTHMKAEDKHAVTVAKGLQYLISMQTADGDLRGESRAVGMYCHAMATLAICEAFALSGDSRLREPAQRAVDFLAKARAADGLSWRYKPGDPSGDTSLLGWAILVFKSADEVGLNVPPTMRQGALGWLKQVSAGRDGGLAVYRPNEGPYGGAANYVPGRNMTPTMSAEAWVCRQFLGIGGPGSASDEAAVYLLQNRPERTKLNLYYWYYGTLAMKQRGGEDWNRWNPWVRDELVSLQKTSGHQAGSWTPSDSKSAYDARGGRIYCTALATMTLEVYYRYGKLEEKPSRVAPRDDSTIRRTAR